MKLRQTKYIIGLAFIALGVGIIVVSALPKSLQYYVTVDELLATRGKYAGQELKVAGKVAPASIRKSEQDLLWNFAVVNAGQTVSVSYRGAMPDTFKEGADVVVTGKYEGQDHIEATHVLAKCASRYEEKLTPTYR